MKTKLTFIAVTLASTLCFAGQPKKELKVPELTQEEKIASKVPDSVVKKLEALDEILNSKLGLAEKIKRACVIIDDLTSDKKLVTGLLATNPEALDFFAFKGFCKLTGENKVAYHNPDSLHNEVLNAQLAAGVQKNGQPSQASQDAQFTIEVRSQK